MDFYEKASSQQIVSSLDVHISNSKVFMDTNALPCLGSYILHGGSDVDMVKKYNLFMSYFVKWLDNDNLVILPRVSQEMNARLCYSVRNVKNIDETAEVRTYLDLVEKVKFKLSDKYFSSFIGFEEGLKLLEEANILMS